MKHSDKLDDHSLVHKLDEGNALGIIAGQPGQLKQAFDFRLSIFDCHNIVVAGMGGSVLGAEFLRSWLADRLPLPLVVVRDYTLPAFVSEKSLVVISSYSGNTEETLSALETAKASGARIVIISAGGELKQLAQAGEYPFLEVPGGFQPRLAVLFGAKALAVMLEQLGLVGGLVTELEAGADWVTPRLSAWTGETATADNLAKQIAQAVHGFPAVIYGGPTLSMPARKWKIDFNENAKNVAFWYELPEFNHNEFTGWLNPADKHLRVIELQSSLDHPQIAKRYEVSNRLLAGKMPEPIIVSAQGETKLQQMLWTLLLGDFTSAYLAFLNGIDPTPVDLIEKLKQELA